MRWAAALHIMRLLVRRERWGLTWQGWIAGLLLLAALGWTGLTNLHSFLAVDARTNGSLLAVEGWVHPYAIRAAAELFSGGSYEHIYTTGGPVTGSGGYTNDYNTSAAIAASRLKAAGLPADRVTMAPARVVQRDRTYTAAVALRDLLRQRGISIDRLDVLTSDVHARRTRLLFEKAFGDGVRIGVIAVPNPDVDARQWWHYSEGVRDVLSETISYLYARLLFFPPPPVIRDLAASRTQSPSPVP